MSLPSIPSRPRSTVVVGGLVSSRVKAFGNADITSQLHDRIARPAPPKPKCGTTESERRQVHQAATRTLEAFKKVAPSVGLPRPCSKDGVSSMIEKAHFDYSKPLPKPPSLSPPRAAACQLLAPDADATKNSCTVKDIKSKFEHAAAVVSMGDRKLSQPAMSLANRVARPRPMSECFPSNSVENSGDMNNNIAVKVKSIRAELESKLVLRTPDSASVLNNAGAVIGETIAANPNLVKRGSHQTSYIPSEQLIGTADTDVCRFPARINGAFDEERPVLPTMVFKSKPPPRPPPCSLVSQERAPWDSLDHFQTFGHQPNPACMEFQSTPSPQEAWAVVAYDFAGDQSDEITSKSGDKLILKHEVDEWYYAYNTRTGRTGIIPKGFVDVQVPLPTINDTTTNDGDQDNIQSTSDGPRCYTLHDYVSNVAGDLSFLKGEVIMIINRVNDDWLEGGTHDGRRGIFPVTFVEIIEDLPSLKQSDGLVATAVYDFYGENNGDLSFKAGDKILIISRVNSDWLFGASTDNRSGIFPSSFVDQSPCDLPSYYGSN